MFLLLIRTFHCLLCDWWPLERRKCHFEATLPQVWQSLHIFQPHADPLEKCAIFWTGATSYLGPEKHFGVMAVILITVFQLIGPPGNCTRTSSNICGSIWALSFKSYSYDLIHQGFFESLSSTLWEDIDVQHVVLIWATFEVVVGGVIQISIISIPTLVLVLIDNNVMQCFAPLSCSCSIKKYSYGANTLLRCADTLCSSPLPCSAVFSHMTQQHWVNRQTHAGCGQWWRRERRASGEHIMCKCKQFSGPWKYYEFVQTLEDAWKRVVSQKVNAKRWRDI